MSLDGKFIKDGTIPSSKWIISPDFVLENKGGTGSFITTNATHTITGGDYSSILGGTNNTITSAGNYILLIGGNNNLIESNAQQSASSSFIIGGGGSTAFAQNHIIGHTSSGIIGGSSNKIGTTTSTGASHNFIINSISTNIDSGNNLVNVIGSVDTTALNAIDGVTALSVQSVTMTQSNTVYMPKVRIGLGINGALEDGSVSDDILVRNILTGEIEIRDASTLGGPASTSGGVISVFGRTGHIQAQLGDYAATLVEYDNGISGLLANNVQSAIDELASSSSTSGNVGNGDMTKIIYDPTNVEDDAFDYNNFNNTPALISTTDDLTEGSTNLYYTNTRVSSNVDVAANTTDRHTHTNKSALDDIVNDGSGDLYLSDDGTYKLIESADTSGYGDMTEAVYDPTGIQDDVFDYNNFTNIPDIPSNAEEILYDNGTSGLAAINVQDAIDEVIAGQSGYLTSVEDDPLPTLSNDLHTNGKIINIEDSTATQVGLIQGVTGQINIVGIGSNIININNTSGGIILQSSTVTLNINSATEGHFLSVNASNEVTFVEPTALNIDYVSSGTNGLVSDNVQDAIDELATAAVSTTDINLEDPVSIRNYGETSNLQDVIEKVAEALRNLGLLDTLKLLYGDSTSGAGIKIQSKEIILTSADILDLHNNSYVIHDAYQDSFIVPIQAVFITVGVNNYAGEEDLELYYDGDSSGSYTFKDALTNTRSGVKRMNIMKQGNNTGVYTDTALLFRAKNNNAVTGTGNGGTLKILYVIID